MKSGKAEAETRERTQAKIAALEGNASQLKDYSWLSQVPGLPCYYPHSRLHRSRRGLCRSTPCTRHAGGMRRSRKGLLSAW